MVLNQKQSEILELVLNGNNILITGGAGVGKSYSIKYICKYFDENNINYGLTASTGCAAVLIGGKTLHSFLGIGLAKGTPYELIKRIYKIEGLIGKLTCLKVLIIDEISMINDELFDKIAEIFKILHKSKKPFGNLQIILVGDFLQLKPIQGDYCFRASNWDNCNFNKFILTENIRVHNDPDFDELLKRVRIGKIKQSDMTLMESMKNTTFSEGIIPTKLFSKNKDVDDINQFELNNLIKSGAEVKTWNIIYLNKMKTNMDYTNTNKISNLILCVGAQVMCTRNISETIVNGTRGVIVSFGNDYISIKLKSGEIYDLNYFHVKPDIFNLNENKDLNFKYIPLMLSWACSIHKGQGSTIDALEIDLGDSIFTTGQFYTALSRGTGSKSIKISNLNKSSIKVSKTVIDFYETF